MEGKMSVKKSVLKVAVAEWVPHIKVDKDAEGNLQISGPMANLLEALSITLNFGYILVSPSDGAWGIPQPNGSWNGMIGMVSCNEADIALGPFGLTYSRSRVVEFSVPVTYDYYRILVKRPTAEPNPWSFLSPFGVSVWLVILLCIVVTAIALTIIWKLVGKETTKNNTFHYRKGSIRRPAPKTVNEYIWAVFGSATTQSFPWLLGSWSGRIVVAAWLLMVLVLTKSHSSSLTSLLAVRTVDAKYNYLLDVVDDSKLHLIFEQATALVEFMSNVKSGIYKRLADTNKEGRASFLPSTALFDAAYGDVRGGKSALLVEETTCRKVFSDDFTKYGRCEFFLGKEKYWPLIFCIIGRKGHPMMEGINTKIQRIVDQDLYSKWLSNEVPNATACLKARTKISVLEAYTLQELWGIFIVLTGGLISASICILVEYFVNCIKHPN